jgi:hypothetical protein
MPVRGTEFYKSISTTCVRLERPNPRATIHAQFCHAPDEMQAARRQNLNYSGNFCASTKWRQKEEGGRAKVAILPVQISNPNFKFQI